MKKTLSNKEIREHLDILIHEINKLKSNLVYQSQPDTSKSDEVWNSLMKDSEDVSTLWSGCSSLEEIQHQRGS